MDRRLGDSPSSMNGNGYGLLNRLSLQDTVNDERRVFGMKVPPLQPEQSLVGSSSVPVGSVANSDEESLEDYDFSDVVLKYISQMLMEEDIEEKTCMFQESAALQAAEKSLYEVIGEKYPPSPGGKPVSTVQLDHKSPDEICGGSCITVSNCSSVDRIYDSHGPEITSAVLQPMVQASSSREFTDSPISTLQLPQFFTDDRSMSQFKKGFEEASKFLPDDSILTFDVTGGWQLDKSRNPDGYSSDGSRGKKNRHPDAAVIGESRSHKHSALSSQSIVSPEMFDMVLLGSGGGDAALRESLQSAQHQDEKSKGQTEGKSRGKKKGRKRDVVDLRTLLTLCAQAVAANDRRSANDHLSQIRRHSSSTGDGMQRLAHYFANGLEARLAGSGTEIYKALMATLPRAADILKAYHLYITVCPFRKISNFFSNKTTMKIAGNKKKLHIVDFGILYGFQWPCLIQRLSSLPDGPPKVRITGIELPQPGFRPTERVEETGRRLTEYAKTFGVPFEFKAIAQRWETIKLEDLRIDPDEVLVVNCMFRLRNLLDETVIVDNPRDMVLDLIRRMNPNIFILGLVSGAYNAPFFITRFREVLFHYSAIFDALDVNVPREIPERMLIEKEIFGREAMNVIACEGAERIERPETYKQCQVRVQRAGFRQLPLDEEIVEMAKCRVRTYYHKDFEINEDGHWLLQGWKGRILYALSTWRAIID